MVIQYDGLTDKSHA